VKTLIASGTAIAAALAIGACGGGGGGASSSAGASAGGAGAVSVKPLPNVGRVLVNQSGKALYTSNVEASGQIVCSGGCTAFWKPVTANTGKPPSGTGTGKLGVIKRPDGTTQLTANGRPLYTFSEDSPGKATGDGFTDDFSGHHFIWHLVRTGGKTANTGQTNDGAVGNGAGGGAPSYSSPQGGPAY
jgi:predicted lipoprotein with Yx(FWY)xxD motif